MPVSVGFAQPDVFLVDATGVVTYAEVYKAIDDIMAHPAQVAGRKILVDGREVTGVPSAAELRMIAHDIKPLIAAGIGPMAIVTSRPLVYGVARMFAVFAEVYGMDVQVFYQVDDASRWLAESA